MLTLQLSSSFRREQYLLSANTNSTVFSISTGLYLFRPVMYSGMFFRYLLKSIPSMNRSNANTGSDIEKNLKEILVFFPAAVYNICVVFFSFQLGCVYTSQAV